MKKLKIVEIGQYNSYKLQTDDGKMVRLILEFYSMPKPKVGDEFFIDEKLLDRSSEYFVQPYAFEKTDIKLNDVQNDDIEIAVLKTENKTIVLKRLYG